VSGTGTRIAARRDDSIPSCFNLAGTIAYLLRYFPFKSQAFGRLNKLFREEIIVELAATNPAGMIFTYVWDLRDSSDKHYLEDLIGKFTSDFRDVCFLELCADQRTRLDRNRSENRLSEKPSKRNLDWSDDRLRAMDRDYVLNTSEAFPFYFPDQLLKIDNSGRDSQDVARQVIKHFGLASKSGRE